MTAAATAGLATYALVDSGMLGGLMAFCLLAGLLLLAPSHPRLTRRVSVNTALFLGVSHVTWWVDWPVRVNHAGAVMGLAAAVTVAVALRGRSLRPVATRGEIAMMLAAPAAGAAAVAPWASSGSPREALEQMLPGVDNATHFSMFWSLRSQGAVPEALGLSPDGSAWGHGVYPQGFHATVATLSEMFAPRLDDGAQALPEYLHASAALVVLSIIMVSATVLGMRQLHLRPMVTLPVLVLTSTALLWEPGQHVFANGFLGFWLGAVAAGVSLLIAVSERRPTLLDVAAVTGLVMLVFHCWLPLALLAAPAVVLVLVPHLGPGWRKRTSVPVVLLLGVGALGSLRAALELLGTVRVGYLVTADGGYDAPAIAPVLVLALVGVWVLLVLGSPGPGRTVEPFMSVWQTRLLLFTPVAGAALLAALFVTQVRRTGTTSYYFVKLLLGYELVLAVVVPALVAALVFAVLPRQGHSWPRALASLTAAVAALVAFGVLTPAEAPLFDDHAPGTASIAPPYDRGGMAEGILVAASETTPGTGFDTVYVALGRGNAGELFYPESWFHALNGSVTHRVMVRMNQLHVQASTPEEAVPVVTELLLDQPDLRILVAREEAMAVQELLGSGLADRVVPIPTGDAR